MSSFIAEHSSVWTIILVIENSIYFHSFNFYNFPNFGVCTSLVEDF